MNNKQKELELQLYVRSYPLSDQRYIEIRRKIQSKEEIKELLHAVFYSDEPLQTRIFFKDKLQAWAAFSRMGFLNGAKPPKNLFE